MPGFYKPEPNETHAYHKDSSSNEYYGWAASGTKRSELHWQIVKLTYSSGNWIEGYPVDTNTGLGSDQPIFEWDEVESYAYRGLGTKA